MSHGDESKTLDIMAITRQHLLEMGARAWYRVQQHGDSAIGAVQEAANKNVTGPEASFVRRVRRRTQQDVACLKQLENQPKRTPATQKRIDDTEEAYFREVTMDAVTLQNALQKQGSGFKIPAFIKKVIDRKGIPVLGGGLRPEFKLPPRGVQWVKEF